MFQKKVKASNTGQACLPLCVVLDLSLTSRNASPDGEVKFVTLETSRKLGRVLSLVIVPEVLAKLFTGHKNWPIADHTISLCEC